MSTELYYQRQILVDAKAQDENVYAIKMAHRFLSGIPDLMIKMPGHDVLFVEVKKGDVGKTGKVKIDTTALQRSTMATMGRAGFRCEVWVVLPKASSDRWPRMLRTSPDMTVVQLHDVDALPARARGEPWDVRSFIENPVKDVK